MANVVKPHPGEQEEQPGAASHLPPAFSLGFRPLMPSFSLFIYLFLLFPCGDSFFLFPILL